MKNKRILITGACGSVGSELVRQLYKSNRVYGFDINETGVQDLLIEQYGVYGTVGDIRNMDALRKAFKKFKPQIVIHAAAYKHVPRMQEEYREAISVNEIGTANVIETAKEFGVKTLIYISTDKVVSGEVMGTSKKQGENITRVNGYKAVRFGNVLGSRGSVMSIWERQLNKGQDLTITDPRMMRYIMSMEEACGLIIEAIKIDAPGKTLIMKMGRPVNIVDLAKEIIAKSRKDIGIKFIGIRPGEVLEERLMTEDEEKRAIEQGNFFII